MPLLALSMLFSIALCVHVVRSGREMYWLFIILFLQPLGGVVYLVAVVLPEMLGGKTARRVRTATRERLDPERDYREAQVALEAAPTVRNCMRLAQIATTLGRHEEAEQLYAEAAVGVHADDPALLLGRAQSLLEVERPAEALVILQRLGELGEEGRTPEAALAMARAYGGLGRGSEADDAYLWAMERMPGFEAPARYAVHLARSGRPAQAQAVVDDLDGRISRLDGDLRREAQHWRNLAAASLAR